MPDFSHLTRRTAGEAKKPPVMPIGDYPATIVKFVLGDENKNKTPYVRFFLKLYSFPDSASEEEKAGIDLDKREQRRDFYLTEDALWRLDELVRSCGVSYEGRTYDEVFPEMIGAGVLVSISQQVREVQGKSDVFSQVDKVMGTAGQG